MNEKNVVEFIANQIHQEARLYSSEIQGQLMESYERFNQQQRLAVNEMFCNLTGYTFEALKSKFL